MKERSSSRIAFFIFGAAVGIIAAHLQGIAYVKAARQNTEQVFRAFDEAFKEEIQVLPAGHQLVAARAGRIAMEAALRENRAKPFWSSLIGAERP